MNKRIFTLTTDQAHALLAAQIQTKHAPTCLRYLAVRLYGTGYAVETIQTMLGCGRTSLMEWCAAYRSHGLDGLRDKRTGGNHRKLTSDQVIDLTHKLRQYTPRSLFGSETVASGEYWTLPDLRRAIQYWYGVTYQSDTSYRSLFHRCGFSSHRPSRVFRSRNQQMVDDFEDQIEKK
jgi:transposase